MFPAELPYTVAAEQFREEHPLPSIANIAVPKSAAEYVIPSSVENDDRSDDVFYDVHSGIQFSAGPKRSFSRVSTGEGMTSGGSFVYLTAPCRYSCNLGSPTTLR
jgi:hypothetical protein